MNARFALAALLIAFAVTASAASVYSIDAHIVSSGSSTHTSSVCFGMDVTIGEPVAGFSSGGAYDLSAVFEYAAPVVSDTIFANSFEDCSP